MGSSLSLGTAGMGILHILRGISLLVDTRPVCASVNAEGQVHLPQILNCKGKHKECTSGFTNTLQYKLKSFIIIYNMKISYLLWERHPFMFIQNLDKPRHV